MLKVRRVKKSYGQVVALRGVDLDVDAGSVVALLGRNGAGKSTLLSAVAGLLQPDSGTIEVAGIDVWAEPNKAKSMVGIAPQQTGIYRAVSVRENLIFFAELAGLRRQNRNRQVSDVAEQLGLTHLLDRKATQLSGGEARRLHTACALVHHPKLLLLDEPTVGADVATRNGLIEAVRNMAEDGAAVVYTTHYLPEVSALDADIVVIEQGQVLARGTQGELVERYRTEGVEIELDRPIDAPPAGLEGERLSSLRWRFDHGHSLADVVGRFAAELTRADDAKVVAAELVRPDLERVFLTITGVSLDDDPSDKEQTI